MAEYDSSSEEEEEETPKLPIFKHIIGTREIASTSSSAQTFASNEKILKISSNQLSPRPSAAATYIGHSANIFTDILLCLPPKSLLRFQCVSKQWHSVISNSNFRRLHCRTYHTCCLSPKFDALLFFDAYFNPFTIEPPSDYKFNFISFSEENVNLMDSITTGLTHFITTQSFLFWKICGVCCSNGLFCIHFVRGDEVKNIVYNPITNCYKLIPECKIAGERFKEIHIINIYFNPLKSDHYKLVFLYIDYEDSACYCYIFYSETGIWKDINSSMEINTRCLFDDNGIFLNDNLHWINRSRSILCFDLNKESFNWSVPSVPILDERAKRTNCWYFGESGDCLCAIEKKLSELMLFDIFMMEKDYFRWLLKTSIDFNPLTILYPSLIYEGYDPQLCFTHFLKCNNEKKESLVISMEGKIILYNLIDKNVVELVGVEASHGMGTYDWDQTIKFTPTLAPV